MEHFQELCEITGRYSSPTELKSESMISVNRQFDLIAKTNSKWPRLNPNVRHLTYTHLPKYHSCPNIFLHNLEYGCFRRKLTHANWELIAFIDQENILEISSQLQLQKVNSSTRWFACLWMYVCLYVSTYVCIQMYVYVCMCIHI